MKRLIPLLSAGTFLVLSGTGCIVDDRYDPSKLDTEMTVLKGAEFPVPPVSFQLGELLQLDGYDFITCDEIGDYLVRFDLDPVDVQVLIPAFVGGVHIPVDFQPIPFSFGSVPDFISGKDQQFEADLSDMTVELGVASGIPASFSTSGTVESLSQGVVQNSCHFDDLWINPGNQTYYLKEKATSDNEITVPGLGQMLSPFPDAIQLSHLDLYADAGQEFSGLEGQTYDLSFRTRVESPICFRANHRITLSLFLHAELDLEQIGLKRAILKLAYDNRIPLNFSMVAYALDAQGNRIEGVKAETSDIIRGQSVSKAGLELTTNGDLRFSQILLELTVSSDSQIAGMHINKNQELRFTDVSLYLPDGIQIRLDSDK